MKYLSPVLTVVTILLTLSCQQHSGETAQDSEVSENQILYDEVMAVHDEVMPKMNDLYKAKTALQTRHDLPGTSETERQDIKRKIDQIDLASENMMVWMRQFKPLADSVGEDKARAYLENEMVKVKKVREDILAALETDP